MKKKSAFRVLAEANTFGGLKKAKLPTSRIDSRKLSIDEIKQFISEEFKDAKKVSDIEVEEKPGGWGDDALENEIEWVKKLDIKEFFQKKKSKANMMESVNLSELQKQLGDSHYVTFDDGQVSVWNKGTQGVGPQMAARIDKDGNIQVTPGNEWIKSKLLQAKDTEEK